MKKGIQITEGSITYYDSDTGVYYCHDRVCDTELNELFDTKDGPLTVTRDEYTGTWYAAMFEKGGSVHAAGALIGSLLLVIIRNGLNFALAKRNITLNATYVTYVITGVIVVLAVFLDKTKEQHGRKKTDTAC